MPRKNTIGSFMLKALAAILGFNIIFLVIKLLARSFKNELEWVISATNAGWVFAPTVHFIQSTYAWIYLLLADAMAFATLLFISLILEAYETRWH